MSSGLFSFGARKSARVVHATHSGRFRSMPFYLRVRIFLIHFELSIMQTQLSLPRSRFVQASAFQNPSPSHP